MKLFLIRHGQTEWNLQHRTQGQWDSPLTATGVLQADLVAKALSSQTIDAFYCSDSGRATQTANRIALGNPGFPEIRTDARLRELNYGQWEGLSHDEIVRDYPDLHATFRKNPESFRAPKGESFDEMLGRFVAFLNELSVDSTANVVIVSHAGLIRVALVVFGGKPISEIWAVPSIPGGSISTAERNLDVWKITAVAAVGHLSPVDVS